MRASRLILRCCVAFTALSSDRLPARPGGHHAARREDGLLHLHRRPADQRRLDHRWLRAAIAATASGATRSPSRSGWSRSTAWHWTHGEEQDVGRQGHQHDPRTHREAPGPAPCRSAAPSTSTGPSCTWSSTRRGLTKTFDYPQRRRHEPVRQIPVSLTLRVTRRRPGPRRGSWRDRSRPTARTSRPARRR